MPSPRKTAADKRVLVQQAAQSLADALADLQELDAAESCPALVRAIAAVQDARCNVVAVRETLKGGSP